MKMLDTYCLALLPLVLIWGFHKIYNDIYVPSLKCMNCDGDVIKKTIVLYARNKNHKNGKKVLKLSIPSKKIWFCVSCNTVRYRQMHDGYSDPIKSMHGAWWHYGWNIYLKNLEKHYVIKFIE